jgi:hypothetical protein
MSAFFIGIHMKKLERELFWQNERSICWQMMPEINEFLDRIGQDNLVTVVEHMRTTAVRLEIVVYYWKHE